MFILGIVLMLVGVFFAVGWAASMALLGLTLAWGALKLSFHSPGQNARH